MYQKLENYGQVFLFEVTAQNLLVKMIFLAKSLSILLGCRDIAGKFTSKFCVVTASSRKVSPNRAGILPEQEKPLAQSFGCAVFFITTPSVFALVPTTKTGNQAPTVRQKTSGVAQRRVPISC